MKITIESTRKFFTTVLAFTFLSIAINSCKKVEIGLSAEEIAIQAFLIEREIDVDPTITGLYYIEQTEGIGESPVLSDTVAVYYKGMFLDGRVFEARLTGDPYTFPIGEGKVIWGWEEGLSYMKPGGVAMLIIPSDLAYGSSGSGQIPGSTPLLFEVELVSVKLGPNH